MTITKAKKKRYRRRKPGDIAKLRRVLWEAILEAEDTLCEATEPEIKLRAVSAISTIGGVYLKTLEHHDVVARIEALEAKTVTPWPKRVA